MNLWDELKEKLPWTQSSPPPTPPKISNWALTINCITNGCNSHLDEWIADMGKYAWTQQTIINALMICSICSLVSLVFLLIRGRPVWKEKNGISAHDHPDGEGGLNNGGCSTLKSEHDSSGKFIHTNLGDHHTSQFIKDDQLAIQPASQAHPTYNNKLYNTSIKPPKTFQPQENVEEWISKFENFVRNLDIGDNKYLLLLTNINSEAVRKLTSTIEDDDPEAYQKGIFLLKKCYEQEDVSPADTEKRFFDRVQLEHENVYAYITELKALAKEIFPDMPTTTLDKYVKKQFLTGLRDNKLREKLMFENPMSKSLEELLLQCDETIKVLRILATSNEDSAIKRRLGQINHTTTSTPRRRFEVVTTINDQTTKCLVDTGADVTLISEEFANKINVKIAAEHKPRLYQVDMTPLKHIGLAKIALGKTTDRSKRTSNTRFWS